MVGLSKIIIALSSVFFGVHSGSFDESISFYVYPQNGSPLKYNEIDQLSSLGCSTNGTWAVIVHGYRDSPQYSKYVPEIASKLSKYRGGCVIVMDYSNYSLHSAYYSMLDQFDGISGVLLKKVNQMFEEGFKADNGFMFGFSFGAELVFDVGIKTGGKIARIDACEPPSPGFEDATRNPKKAAKNVQCINTSTTFGTTKRDCHQNWLMGNCGVSQPAVGYFLAHSVCPYIYESAFENNFFAENNPLNCQRHVGSIAVSYPADLRMGYTDERITEVSGTLFSRTYETDNYAAQ